VTDDELAFELKAALLRDRRLSSRPIDVLAQRGVITLRGVVQNHRRKLAATEIAASFRDCRAVLNELTVEPPDPLRDPEIADLVRLALQGQPDVTKPTIAVSVKSGIVILGGSVGSDSERRIAEDVALAVQSVRDVRNLLIIDPAAREVGMSQSCEIEAAMADLSELHGTTVHAAVVGESVVLSGRVSAHWQRRDAESVVCRFGFIRIRNDIVIAGVT
jgi:osmotically-inducible protein OsmY